MKALTYVGKKVGRLTVISKTTEKDKHGCYLWKCKCDCGNYKLVKGSYLSSSDTRSCGCLHKETTNAYVISCRLATPEQSQINMVLRRYKRVAAKRKLRFDLTYSEWYSLTQNPCHYCGAKFSGCMNPNKNYNYSKPFYYNGIDRLDSTLGYTLQNCVTCCKICNRAKSDLTYDEFVTWIGQVYTFKKNNL